MRVLAIDPGYERVGIAILEKNKGREKLLYSNCIVTDKKLPLPERLHIIGSKTESIIRKYIPGAVALEKIYFNRNQKTAGAVSEMRGVILFAAGKHGLPVFEYTPQKVKTAITGYGKGEKEQVMKMVRRLISLEKEIRYDDEYDAIAIGLTCLQTERF